MKKFKILFAVITVVAMLFTVASASVLKFDAETVEYTEGSDLTISVYAAEAFTATEGASFEVRFDADVWEYAGFTFNTDLSSDGMVGAEDWTGEADLLTVNLSTATKVSPAVGQKIVDIKFTKKAGDAVGTEFVFDSAWECLTNVEGPLAYGGKITVAAPAPAKKLQQEFGTKIDGAALEGFDNTSVLAVDITANAEVDGEEGEKYGFTLTNGTVDKDFDLGTTISGDGVIEYVFAFYGVPEEVAISATPYVWIMK